MSITLVFLTIFSVASLLFNYATTGDFIKRDVTLSEGISITINTEQPVDADELQRELSNQFKQSSINVRSLQISGTSQGIIIEDSTPEDEPLIREIMQQKLGGLSKNDISVEKMGSTLGKSFFREMFLVLLVSFFAMGLVFLYYFRDLFATGAALISAFLDLFITLGIITALGVRLTSGGIASFLMLISYSIDTSILISTKMIKEKKKTVNEGLFEAMKTGLTMSAAGITAMFIAFLLTNNAVLKQIMLILVIGLIVDLFTTWIGNVSILRYDLNKKGYK
ncbi:MAG: hypothetical protein KKF44_10370 [Nanoarchaeota archaeon]|nr:hypothetical protein [Nanoarchaeota archaeon]